MIVTLAYLLFVFSVSILILSLINLRAIQVKTFLTNTHQQFLNQLSVVPAGERCRAIKEYRRRKPKFYKVMFSFKPLTPENHFPQEIVDGYLTN